MGKKHLTTQNIVDVNDPVYAQDMNYGQSSTRSVSDVITRHFEDFSEIAIEDQVYNGLVCSQSGTIGVNVTAGNASVKGRWYEQTSTSTVVLSTTADTYYIVVQLTDDGGTQETRNPQSDTLVLKYVADGDYDETTDFVIARAVVSGGIITSFTDFGAYYTQRMDYIKPYNTSKVAVYTGAYPESLTQAVVFSGSAVKNIQDNGGFYGGAGDDFRLYHNGSDNIFNNVNGDFLVQFGGTTYYTLSSGSLVTELNEFTFNDGGVINVASKSSYITLGVSEFEIDNDAHITGNLIVSGSLTVSGSSIIDDDWYVTGDLIVDTNVTIGGNTEMSGTLSVSGTVLIDDDLTVTGAQNVNNNLYVSNNFVTSGTLSVSGATLIDDTFTATGNTYSRANHYVTGATVLSGTLAVSGVTTFAEVTTFNSNVYAQSFSGTVLSGTSLSLTGLTASRLMYADSNKQLTSVADLTAWIDGTTNQISSTSDGDGTMTLSTPQDLHSGASPQYQTIRYHALTASRPVALDSNKDLESTTFATWVSGTSNQISVADGGDGSITLSTPQNIHTGATPTFSRLTLSQTTGTAPLTVSSTTVVGNLNADKVDGYDLNQGIKTTDSPAFAGLTLSGSLVLSSPATTLSLTELSYLDGASSNLQTQINALQNVWNHTMYGSVRLSDFSWVDTDEYIQCVKTTATSFTGYIYIDMLEGASSVRVGNYCANQCTAYVSGGTSLSVTVTLQYLDSGGTWQDLSSDNVYLQRTSTGTDSNTADFVLDASSADVQSDRTWRIEIVGSTTISPGNSATSTVNIYGVQSST